EPGHGPEAPAGDNGEGGSAPRRRSPFGAAFARWEGLIDFGIATYVRLLDRAMRRRGLVLITATAALVAVVVGLGPRLRREFFPEVDAGAFEIYVRAPSGTRVEVTEERLGGAHQPEKRIVGVEEVIRQRLGDDLETLISEIGVTPDWAAAYTPNSGPMDAVIKVQLKA